MAMAMPWTWQGHGHGHGHAMVWPWHGHACPWPWRGHGPCPWPWPWEWPWRGHAMPMAMAWPRAMPMGMAWPWTWHGHALASLRHSRTHASPHGCELVSQTPAQYYMRKEILICRQGWRYWTAMEIVVSGGMGSSCLAASSECAFCGCSVASVCVCVHACVFWGRCLFSSGDAGVSVG